MHSFFTMAVLRMPVDRCAVILCQIKRQMLSLRFAYVDSKDDT